MRTSGPTTYKKLYGFIVGESEKAIKFKVDMPGYFINGLISWFPISQINYTKRSHSASEGLDEIDVADWLVQRKAEEYANISEE